jgi:AcrR family transcriptional regulator
VPLTYRQQADEGILDTAAGLFARRGYAKTSLQDVADAVGLSKAGLLHHWPSKDALHAAVLGHAAAVGSRLLAAVDGLPPGAARDRRALEAVVDVALASPGLVSLLLSPVLAGDAGTGPATDVEVGALQVFGVDPGAPVSERSIRVVGALGALAVLALAANQHSEITSWRQVIVATCSDALGHCRPGASPTRSDQVEA